MFITILNCSKSTDYHFLNFVIANPKTEQISFEKTARCQGWEVRGGGGGGTGLL